MSMLTPLGALIERVKAERGESEEDFARRARSIRSTITRRPHQISKQKVNNLKYPLTTLVPEKLLALADGMQVPLARVVEAALPAAGLPLPTLPDDWSPEAAIESDPELPDAAKRMLLNQLIAARAGEPVGAIRTLHPTRRAARHREEP